MEKIKEFEDLEVWKEAHHLALEIYRITKHFPKEELYGLTSQLRRAAVSISANISEAFGRYHFKEKVNFYLNSRGSVSEVQNFLILARDLGFIDTQTCRKLVQKGSEISQLLNGLIRSIRKSFQHWNR